MNSSPECQIPWWTAHLNHSMVNGLQNCGPNHYCKCSAECPHNRNLVWLTDVKIDLHAEMWVFGACLGGQVVALGLVFPANFGSLHHIFLRSLTLTASFRSTLMVTCPFLKSPIRLGLSSDLAGTNSVVKNALVLSPKVRRNETLDIWLYVWVNFWVQILTLIPI